MNRRTGTSVRNRRAAALIVVLWSVVLLSVILTNYAFTVRTSTRLAANYSEVSLLQNIAAGGVERALAHLLEETEVPVTRTQVWHHDPELFREVSLGDGTFTLFHLAVNGDRQVEVRYGLEDEASKINLRTADREMLQGLGLTPEQVDSLLDWQDGDHNPREHGAEVEFYAALDDPYPAKNAPLDTLHELMLVRGFTPESVYGVAGGRLTPDHFAERDYVEIPGDEEIAPLGILPYITLYSEDRNVTPGGNTRVNINSAGEEALMAGIPGLTEEEARAIVAHRQNNRFEQIGQLLQVREAPQEEEQTQQGEGTQQQRRPQGRWGGQQQGTQPQGGWQQGGRGGFQPGGQRGGGQQQQQQQQGTGQQQEQQEEGELIFSKERLQEIIEYCAIDGDQRKPGRVNINTAPVEVLRALPGINNRVAQSIVAVRDLEHRSFSNIAELLDIPGMTDDNFIRVSEHVTVRSDQFRVRSWAKIDGVKQRRLVEAVVSRNGNDVTILYWNER